MKLPSRLTALTGALLVLLPALAILQYRWVGQLGDAARERMQRNLHNAAQQFRDDFDGEIARAFVSLQADSDLSPVRYRERYAAWTSTAAYPWLVANVFVVSESGRALKLHRWDTTRSEFVAAAWSGPLASAQGTFAAALERFLASGEPRPAELAGLRERDEFLIAPLVRMQIGTGIPPTRIATIARVFGYTVIELNARGIRERLVPLLVQRHFSHEDDEGYRVAVIDSSKPPAAIYKSSVSAPTDPSRADVSVPIFGGYHDPMLFLTRSAPLPAGDKHNFVVSVVREHRDGRTTMRSQLSGSNEGRWRLLAQHARGSLDAAVGDVRQRNLLVSFGILLLMGVSIGLLMLSSQRAQMLAQQQMEFVAGVSHELRTPVAVIHSAAENLSQGVVDDPDRVRRYGEAIEKEARRLGEMIERVLQFAGIESRRIARSPVAIEPLLTEAIDAALAHERGTFTVERTIAVDLPLVPGDGSELRSAIQNLIGNAVKYGGADGWVGVRAEVAQDGQLREVKITVEDHGRGISAADLPHIFDPFYRGAEAMSRQIQGSGLGLALVPKIARAHGGRISVATREGAGTAFTLHLPAPAAIHDKPSLLRSPNEAAAG